jgi:hypothetical protein
LMSVRSGAIVGQQTPTLTLPRRTGGGNNSGCAVASPSPGTPGEGRGGGDNFDVGRSMLDVRSSSRTRTSNLQRRTSNVELNIGAGVVSSPPAVAVYRR